MQRADPIQVLAEVEAAIQLLQVLRVVVPRPISFEWLSAFGVAQVQFGQPWIGPNARHASSRLLRLMDGGVEGGIGLCKRVIVAESEKRLNPKFATSSGAVLNDDGLLAMNEKDRLVQARAAGFVGPDWERIESKPNQMAKTGGGKSAGILVGSEGHFGALDGNWRMQLGQENESLGRRMTRGNQQAVVAAGVGAGHGSHGEATGPVGLQPFEVGGAMEVDALLAAYLDGLDHWALV